MTCQIDFKKFIQVCIVVMTMALLFVYARNYNSLQQQVWNAEEAISEPAVHNPRVNYITNPVGIDSNNIFFSWEPGVKQKAYEIIVTSRAGELVWNSGIVLSDETIRIPYKGEALSDCMQYEYTIYVFDENDKLRCSEKAFFETAFVNGEVFDEAKLISMNPEENIYEDGQAVYYMSFDKYEKELLKATFYGSALGIYDAYINGHQIGDDELKPGWTDYNDTLLYNTYDITSAIDQTNTIAAMAGTGWWCGRNGFGTYGYCQPAFVCQIVLEYVDGEKQIINTDESWKYTKNTAVRSADFFNGETYDFSRLSTARISCGADVESEDEKQVHISSDFKGQYKSYFGYNVKNVSEFDQTVKYAYIYDEIEKDGSDFGSVNICREFETELFPLQLKKGETLIVDFGQNMTGVPYVQYDALNGTQICMQFSEMLNDSGLKSRGNDGPKGSLYRANYRSASTEVKVIANGKDTYRPTFFYTGFRYLSLTADKDITLYDLKGLFIGNSAPVSGNITVGHEGVNQLFNNAAWSQRNNYTLVATDCPQRDERIGWMGDLCSFADTSMYMQDLYSFYDKWMKDVKEAQTQEGAYTDTVPATITTGYGNAGWAEAGILVPLAVYKKYGDKQLLEQHYTSMQSYMDYLASVSSYVPEDKRLGPLTTYGDWLAAQYSDNAMISALWYQADASAMEEIAHILGKSADEIQYRRLYERINEYLLETYAYKMPWNQNGEETDVLSQTEMLFMLRYSKLSDKQVQQIVARLKSNIRENEYKVMTGFAGTPILLSVLTDYGMQNEAYQILLCEENPSWLYSVNMGATTIWERYDSYTKENGFADAAMNSFNHFNEGSAAQWMYESMLGICVDISEKYPITICPVLPADNLDITNVQGWYDSVYGRINLAWNKHSDGTVTMKLEIPQNTSAKVILPLEGMEEMTLEGGEYEWNGKYKLLE